jgi:hypothetical protein
MIIAGHGRINFLLQDMRLRKLWPITPHDHSTIRASKMFVPFHGAFGTTQEQQKFAKRETAAKGKIYLKLYVPVPSLLLFEEYAESWKPTQRMHSAPDFHCIFHSIYE